MAAQRKLGGTLSSYWMDVERANQSWNDEGIEEGTHSAS